MPGKRLSGSSPHARGIGGGLAALVDKRRFIPACAGNSIAIPSIGKVLSVHPRMRGE